MSRYVSGRRFSTTIHDDHESSWLSVSHHTSSLSIMTPHDDFKIIIFHHIPSYSTMMNIFNIMTPHEAPWWRMMTSWWQSTFSSWWIKVRHIFHHDDIWWHNYDGKWWNKFSKNQHDETNEKIINNDEMCRNKSSWWNQ